MAEDAAPEAPRSLAIELAEDPLDVRAIVVGTLAEQAPAAPAAAWSLPALVWSGVVPSDGSGPRPDVYYVRLYADRSAHCQCPDFYFRGLARHDRAFRCKHIRRAWVEHGEAPR